MQRKGRAMRAPDPLFALDAWAARGSPWRYRLLFAALLLLWLGAGTLLG